MNRLKNLSFLSFSFATIVALGACANEPTDSTTESSGEGASTSEGGELLISMLSEAVSLMFTGQMIHILLI